MSEQNERNLESGAPEAAMDRAAARESAPEDRENAPCGGEAETSAAEKPVPKKKGKKRRKKNRIALPVAAALLTVALVFGLAAGYGVGRSTMLERLETAEARVAELTAALEADMGADATAYDAFEEELSGENQAALSDLAGQAFLGDGETGALMGEDDLTGGAEAAETAAAPVVVAEYDGGVLMSDEVAREYDEQMAGFAFAGYSEEEIAGTLLDSVLRYMVSDRVVEARAREMGLYELDDDDRKQIEAEAEADYAEQLDFARDFVDTDGMTEEEALGAAKAYLMESEGVTLDTVRAEIESGWWMQKIYDQVTRDVTVDAAALEAAYAERLAEQKESFEAYPDDFEFAQMNGETVVYNLSGYRAVKLLLIGLGSDEATEAVLELSEQIAALDAEKDAEEIAALQAELDSYYATAESRAQSALEELRGGADFDALIERYGDDEGMKDAAIRERGYYVAANSLLWPQEMIDAAMALEKAGDVSAPARVGDGVCILQYLGEVPAGEVPLDQVRDALQAETLEDRQYDAYEAQVDAWLDEANVKYYPERMQ